ncbi:unnamed protein product [Prunus armeniaca]
MKMVTPLGHLDDTGAEELHLGLEIDLRRRSPLGGTLLGVLRWASWLSSVGMAECGVKKRRRGRMGEGASWAGREKWVLSIRFPHTTPNC